MVDDGSETPGDGQADKRPELMSQRLAVVMVAEIFVRSAVATLRRWSHLI